MFRLTTLAQMRIPLPPQRAPDLLTSYFWSGDAIRSSSVSAVVLSATLAVPVPPARLMADWHRETALRLALEPGDVEPLPLARAHALLLMTRVEGTENLCTAKARWIPPLDGGVRTRDPWIGGRQFTDCRLRQAVLG